MELKKRMTNVFKEQVKDLEILVPNFKIASAIIHYDETSPHLHIVGVPIKIGGKNGMTKQVGKTDVFTKESLRKLQDKMRILCIEEFNKEYGLNDKLKTKKKGRNRDYYVTEMDNYEEMQEQLELNQEKLEIANKKAIELDNYSKEVKDIINNLKTTITSKEKYVLKQEDRDKLVSYIDSVSATNEEFKQIQTLSVTLNNVDEELKENRKKIKLLTENNEALTLRVETLTKNEKTKDKEIDELKEENHSLKLSLDHLINKFTNLIKLIKNKIFSKKETREKYMDFSRDLYTHSILEDKEITNIKEDYDYCKNHDNGKDKDDFEIEINNL